MSATGCFGKNLNYRITEMVEGGVYGVYQRNPLRCSSASSFTTTIVSARRYCAQVTKMAFNKAMGAVNEAANEVDSTEAKNISSHILASGERKVSAMPTQYAPLDRANCAPSTVWRSPRRKLMAMTRSCL